MVFQKIIDSNRIFTVFLLIFILSLCITVYIRGGKDLKAYIYGAQQTLHKQSPYRNLDGENNPRSLFRYGPGFAIMTYPFLLKSKMCKMVNGALQVDNITPSVLTWYFFKILLLLFIAIMMLKIIPSASSETSMRNLKISLLMASPFIACELANSQNKIIALFFMVLALWLFEKNSLFISAICFNVALTVYIPLLIFAVYFLIRRKTFIFYFLAAVFIVFFILPSLVFGVNFNIYLLKEWFTHIIKEFLITNSYATYVDLKVSSQSLPSAIGRMFVSGYTNKFSYLISPLTIHSIIRFVSAIMLLLSCIAIVKRPQALSRGLSYAILLILALVLPQYCVTYTWSYVLLFYFAILNYISYPTVPRREKNLLSALIVVLFIASICIIFKILNQISLLFWSTLFLWAGIIGVLLQGSERQI